MPGSRVQRLISSPLLLGKRLSAAAAAERGLDRPRLEQQMRSAIVGPVLDGFWYGDPQDQQRRVGVVGIDLRELLDLPRRPWFPRRKILLALGDHLQHLAPGGAIPGDRSLIGLVLQGLLDGDLARARRSGSP